MKQNPLASNTTSLPISPLSGEDTSEGFWERRYQAMRRPSNGRVSAAIARFTADRRPGLALELGCARGDDAIWLARQGWMVTGVDVSAAALKHAGAAAAAEGVTDRVRFEQHDLAQTMPGGSYDLVTAMFLHSPIAFGRTNVLRRAANSVAPGGLLLIAAHGSRAPWSEAPPDMTYPTAEEELHELCLSTDHWRRLFVGAVARSAVGPGGQHADVIDTILALERAINH